MSGWVAAARGVDFQAILESAPGLYLILDPELRVVAVTDAYLAATMTRHEEVVGRGIFEVFPDNPDDPAAAGVANLRASLERVRRELVTDVMPVQRYDIRRPAEEGGGFEERFWSPANSPVVSPDGGLRYLLHRVEDVTEFVRAGKAAASQREISAELKSRVDEMAAEVYARSQQVAETSRKLKDANAELARLYEATKELAAAKSQFFASISHELRTPLTLVLAPLERLLATLGPDDASRADLDLARRNALLLLGHINALLDAAKLEAGGIRLAYAEVDMAELVRTVAGFFESRAVERDVNLVVATPPESTATQLDAEQIRRILFNLLGNALVFTPGGGTVRLELRPTSDEVTVEVGDSGPGVPAEERELIFERFRQGSARPGSVPGTGLGLSIVRDLVALHGGSVAVRDAPEGGALFVVTLPRQAPAGTEVGAASRPDWTEDANHHWSVAAAAADVGAPAHDGDERPIVVVVEDNPELNQVICETIGPSCRVVSAFDGQAGLIAARKHQPDLVITDVMMPVMSGDELVDALRHDPQLATVPILVLSARAGEAGRLDLLRSGANDYLVKPFTIKELITRADNLIQLHRAEERLRALELSDDRARIARDLHDLVIQQLYAVGLRLHAAAPEDASPDVRQRITETIDDLDLIIGQLRATIFDLNRSAATDGLRARVVALTADAAQRLGCTPRTTITGAVDTLVDGKIAAELLAVLREALSNVVRHSRAGAVGVTLEASTDEVVLTVSDDGVGPPEGLSAGEGLRNMAARAGSLGGTWTITAAEPAGTEIRWVVPLNRGY
ncbi:MAG TPA: ATP-binding protein [Jatrophihabitans sp.]|nr:ATP-binding protein [Jatrophihabitans sp.]